MTDKEIQPGVRGITNLIAVQPQVSAVEVKHEIEAALLLSAEQDVRRISVDTADSQVILKGGVRAWTGCGPSRGQTLMRLPSPGAPPCAAVTTKKSPPEHASILLVEDNADGRATLAEILDLEGYRVGCASNGQEALDHLRSAPPPSLILLDLMMPVMDGWALLRELAHEPQLAAIPVVIMSAVADMNSDGCPQGIAGCLVKPIDISEVLKLAARHCR